MKETLSLIHWEIIDKINVIPEKVKTKSRYFPGFPGKIFSIKLGVVQISTKIGFQNGV